MINWTILSAAAARDQGKYLTTGQSTILPLKAEIIRGDMIYIPELSIAGLPLDISNLFHHNHALWQSLGITNIDEANTAFLQYLNVAISSKNLVDVARLDILQKYQLEAEKYQNMLYERGRALMVANRGRDSSRRKLIFN